MDSVKEKLVEILRKPIFPHELVDPIEAVAECLLDNDVVSVVRCKDCENYTRSNWCNLLMMDTKDEMFCSYGARRIKAMNKQNGENDRSMSGGVGFAGMLHPMFVVPVVHGQWLWTVIGEEDREQYWRCSVCNDHSYIEYNYCPHCGAKMDGGAQHG